MDYRYGSLATEQLKSPVDFINKEKLISTIDKVPKLAGAKIVFFDGIRFHELRPHAPVCQASKLTVVVKPVAKTDQVVGQNSEITKQDKDRFYSELVSAGLSCGAAVLSWFVVVGSSVAIPVSGGTSTAITLLSYGAATASSLQCMNSGYRLYNETDFGDASRNEWLDSQDWYQSTLTVLDVVSVAGGIASAGATIKTVINLQRSTGKGALEVLKGLTRQERKKLTEELIRAQNPGISNKTLKMMVNAGKYPKRFSNFEVSSAIRYQLKDAIGASLSFAGSATGGVIRDPSRIPDVAVAIIEEFETW